MVNWWVTITTGGPLVGRAARKLRSATSVVSRCPERAKKEFSAGCGVGVDRDFPDARLREAPSKRLRLRPAGGVEVALGGTIINLEVRRIADPGCVGVAQHQHAPRFGEFGQGYHVRSPDCAAEHEDEAGKYQLCGAHERKCYRKAAAGSGGGSTVTASGHGLSVPRRVFQPAALSLRRETCSSLAFSAITLLA